MTPSTFAERFGFARWVRHLVIGEAPTHAEIGRAVERTGQAVSAWSQASEPPTDYRVHAPLATYLGTSEEWLIRGAGEAPRVELWSAWVKERRRAPVIPKSAFKSAAAAKPAAKKRA